MTIDRIFSHRSRGARRALALSVLPLSAALLSALLLTPSCVSVQDYTSDAAAAEAEPDAGAELEPSFGGDAAPPPLGTRQWNWLNPAPTGNTLLGIGGTSESDIWVTGEKGFIAHFDGRRWDLRHVGTAGARYFAVGTKTKDDVWIAGEVNGRVEVIHFNGKEWITSYPFTGSSFGGFSRGPGGRLFVAERRPYENAKLVLFTEGTSTACGYGESATGPFYCPADERVYIDLAFYDELARRYGAKGDFAQAYVIAHEVGHHVQNLLGTNAKVHRAPKSEQLGPRGLSTRLELQADCYAGVWAHSTNQRELLEVGDLEEALGAAQAIGDDALQKMATGRVRPETFSHGSSAQRARWFQTGQRAGTLEACDTFTISNP